VSIHCYTRISENYTFIEPVCRPTLLDQEKSVIEFEELRHPCVVPG
jgi:DNA mismatch repair protein MSH6